MHFQSAAATSQPAMNPVASKNRLQPPPLNMRSWKSSHNRNISVEPLKPSTERSANWSGTEKFRSQPHASQYTSPKPKLPDCFVCMQNVGGLINCIENEVEKRIYL